MTEPEPELSSAYYQPVLLYLCKLPCKEYVSNMSELGAWDIFQQFWCTLGEKK